MKKRWFFKNCGSKAAGLHNSGRSFWILYWKKTVLPARKFFTGHLSLIRELGRQRYIVLSISWRRLVRSAGRICIKIACDEENGSREVCRIEMEDHTVRYLSSKNWNEVILAGLKSCGYIGTQKVKAVVIESCV